MAFLGLGIDGSSASSITGGIAGAGFGQSSLQSASLNAMNQCLNKYQNQAASQYQNIMNPYHSSIGITTTTLADYVDAMRVAVGVRAEPQPQFDPIDMLTPKQRYLRKKYPAMKKLKGILERLRYEIDEWHGDVLDRCAA